MARPKQIILRVGIAIEIAIVSGLSPVVRIVGWRHVTVEPAVPRSTDVEVRPEGPVREQTE